MKLMIKCKNDGNTVTVLLLDSNDLRPDCFGTKMEDFKVSLVDFRNASFVIYNSQDSKFTAILKNRWGIAGSMGILKKS